MNDDRFGRTPDDMEDEARHGYAVGTGVLRAIADKVSEIAHSRWEREHLHNELYHLYELLGTHTVFGMRDEPVTDGSANALWAYGDTYSDGTPVTIVVGPPSSRGWSAPSNERSCDIPWFPNIMSTDDYDPEGPLPPGCEVMVVDPPHRRSPKVRAACEQADSLIGKVRTS
jgi:hypothetical protein